jgi:hypothetical protein
MSTSPGSGTGKKLVSKVVPAMVKRDRVDCYISDSTNLFFSDGVDRHDYKIKVGTPMSVEIGYYYRTMEKDGYPHLAQFVPAPKDLTFMFVFPPKIRDNSPDWAIIKRAKDFKDIVSDQANAIVLPGLSFKIFLMGSSSLNVWAASNSTCRVKSTG